MSECPLFYCAGWGRPGVGGVGCPGVAWCGIVSRLRDRPPLYRKPSKPLPIPMDISLYTDRFQPSIVPTQPSTVATRLTQHSSR